MKSNTADFSLLLFAPALFVGVVAAVLSWWLMFMMCKSQPLAIRSILPAIFLAAGTAPNFWGDGHGAIILPAIYYVPLLFSSGGSFEDAWFVLLPLVGAFALWWAAVTLLPRMWRN